MISLTICFLLFLSYTSASLSTFHASSTSLNTARNGFCMVKYENNNNKWVYVIGGYGGSLQLSSVERSTLSQNGTLDNPFEVLSSTLVTPRSAHACVIVGSFIYVFGGNDPSDISSIEQATILPDGSLSPFATYPLSLPSALSSPSVTYDAITQSVYIIGGYARAVGIMSGVVRGQVDSQGQITSFTTLSSYLNSPRYLHRTILLGRSLIVVGGNAAAVERAAIFPDGSLSSFFDKDASLLSPRLGLSIAYLDGTLYAIGGSANKRPFKTVEALPVSADGSIKGSFTQVSGVELQIGRLSHEGDVFGNEIVVVGGSGTTGADILRSVEAAVYTNGGFSKKSMLRAPTSAPPKSHPHL